MKKISKKIVAETITAKRKEKKLSQAMLSEMTGINRSMIGRAENEEFMPSIEQLQTLGEVLGFEVTDLFVEELQHQPLLQITSQSIRNTTSQ